MEKRKSLIRRDLNDLVRDESGRLSPSKVGTLVGQWLAVKIILQYGDVVIKSWDVLTVLFTILIAPEMLKKLMHMKYGGANGGVVTTTTTEPAADPATTKVTKTTIEPAKKGKA